ncbi:MAG: hydroxymethylbilane synthase [Alphaproteobacteria bacterium]|nr:hydroxymethylbilane synthase [Alphaproteobacteria bacterium]
MKKNFRLGTRTSPLALIQAEIVRNLLISTTEACGESCEIQIIPIRTNGDWRPSQPEQSFLEMGGTKGLFTKEIEDALLEGAIDIAVHSLKDMAAHIRSGTRLSAYTQREDPRDALISPLAPRLEELPAGTRVGTSSLRRKAQILAVRPDLEVVSLRGNIDTRLKKLASGEVDAAVMAVAGLVRLGQMEKVAAVLDTDIMLPAAGQGCLAVQIRAQDHETYNFTRRVHHHQTALCCEAERVALDILGGSCRTPIAIFARPQDKKNVKIEIVCAKPDGSSILRRSIQGELASSTALAETLAQEVLSLLPDGFLSCS